MGLRRKGKRKPSARDLSSDSQFAHLSNGPVSGVWLNDKMKWLIYVLFSFLVLFVGRESGWEITKNYCCDLETSGIMASILLPAPSLHLHVVQGGGNLSSKQDRRWSCPLP